VARNLRDFLCLELYNDTNSFPFTGFEMDRFQQQTHGEFMLVNRSKDMPAETKKWFHRETIFCLMSFFGATITA
jgi:hypothetical protein